MKKILLLFAVAILLLGACKKNKCGIPNGTYSAYFIIYNNDTTYLQNASITIGDEKIKFTNCNNNLDWYIKKDCNYLEFDNRGWRLNSIDGWEVSNKNNFWLLKQMPQENTYYIK